MIWKNTDQKKFLITISTAVLLFYFPLIIRSDYYRDDLFRVVQQKPGWSALGRPFADLFAYILSANWQFLPDSSPFFLVSALLILIASTYRTIQLRNIPFNAITAVLVITFLFNPFLLSCFLYRFDCVIMSAGVACGLLAWGYYPESKLKAAILCFVAMGFYQSYINVFITLIIVEALYGIYCGNNLREIFNFFVKALLTAFVTAVVFYIFDKFFLDEYAAGKSTFIFMADNGAARYLAVIFENVYARYVGFLSTTGKVIYGVAILLAFIEIQLRFYKDTKFDNPIVRASITSIAFLFMLPLSLGVLLGVVGDGGIPPRLMVQSILFSVAIVYLLLRFLTRIQKPSFASNLDKFAYGKLTWGIIGYILLCPLVFSYIATNAISNQNKRDEYLIQRLATSLEKYPLDKPAYILGGFGTAPFVKLLTKDMRLLAHVIPHNSDWTLWLRLKKYGYDNIIWTATVIDVNQEVMKLCSSHLEPDVKHPYFKIYDLRDYLFIWVGNRDMCLTEYNTPPKTKSN